VLLEVAVIELEHVEGLAFAVVHDPLGYGQGDDKTSERGRGGRGEQRRGTRVAGVYLGRM
jgi:hypothetical protein